MKCNKPTDGRSRSHAALEGIRKSAVYRIKNGESPEEVAHSIGFNRRAIYRWLSTYNSGGEDALTAKPISGAPPKLDADQMQELLTIIRERNPLQFKFSSALWTAAIVRELIAGCFKVKLSEVSVWRVMKRLGFCARRQLPARHEDLALLRIWQDQEYPKLVKRAKKEKALIFFADSCSISPDAAKCMPKGQMPLGKASGKHFELNMLSAVATNGQFRFMTVEGIVNASAFREFLERLTVGVDRKVLLIVDNRFVREDKMVRRFIANHSDRLELSFLPHHLSQLNIRSRPGCVAKIQDARERQLST
jgi:transposase